ncbi:MAG: undecaprenyldiphospho-muramoylpentapeptide beta-N-acetylglucosaminyltransferase [Alphaproteobacteria bacterium]|nr:undecaprenyldiphospho-muramoylpentapeptide beta-N-acetylglucosaminyltransferase [Alphaproteobacteria bacterium]
MAGRENLVLLATGGTGGHVFPAEALAATLIRRGVKLALVTDRRGHAYGGALRNLEVHQIQAAPMAGRKFFRLAKAACVLACGFLQAIRLLRRLKPAVVIGFGGYAPVPAMLAAKCLGIPTILHEQNAILGRANHLLAPLVTTLAMSFNATGNLRPADALKVLVTGNPVRQAFYEVREKPYPAPLSDGPFAVLVLGGSQGASVFARIVPKALVALDDTARPRLRVSQQCRPEDLNAVRGAYEAAGIAAEVASFFEDVPARLSTAHLVISRAGASTVAELTTAGRPAILVPYPSATDDHQMANARALDEAGGAWLMPESCFTPEALAARIESFLGLPVILNKAAASAKALGQGIAAERLADAVMELLADSNGHNGGAQRRNPNAREVAA